MTIETVDRTKNIGAGRRAVLEPQSPRSQGSGATTLPEDLLKEQSIRLQLFYATGVILWAINFGMDIYLAPLGDRGPYRLQIETVGAALAAGVAYYTRFGGRSHRTKIGLGVALMVPHAFALALLNSWVEQPTTMRPLSPISVLLLFFGMLAPARPRNVLAAGFVAASMDPIGVWIAHLRGLPTPSILNTLLMFYPNYVCAVLTVAPARVLYRLGRQIREARALGSYQLVERLGEGGMGEVWLARHRLLARSAAIKLIRPEMLSDDGRDQAAATLSRFEREAQATAALTSPHTIRLFDFGITNDGTFYYVMEMLDGRDLESLVRAFGPLPPARALYLLRQVCRSLGEAHAMGLIHRDIKPANIYICRMGLEYDFAKVLDFGLVKHEDGRRDSTVLTGKPMIMGTPAYMAPEVVVGDAGVDRRVDIYALGCVMYYLLTGQRVFNGDGPMKLLMQHVQDAPVPPSQRTEQYIPPEVDRLVLSCLKKDPNQRPASTEELFQVACDCKTAGLWDPPMAKRWWEKHLPQLATAATGGTPALTVLPAIFGSCAPCVR
ncbi:MAG: serine/threonine protein kinase [Blastocatellia bacterium]|nr:MAG: serine/threonine protein kinase [Blastocatellia bacterium]